MKANLHATTEAGTALDATFAVDADTSGFDVIIESRSGAKHGKERPRNSDYEKLFTLLLERAERLGSKLTGAWVVSNDTKHLPAGERKLSPPAVEFPVDLGLIDDLDDFRITLSRMQGAIGRKSGARGPGNRNRRILLRFKSAAPRSERALAAMLVSGKNLGTASTAATTSMTALEGPKECAKALADLRELFTKNAQSLPGLTGIVYWHEDFGTWGHFGESERTDGSRRTWNPFGQIPTDYRSHIVVEINPPVSGQDLDLQGAFACDPDGHRWLIHQGRMSISGKRITQSAFRELSGLRPDRVRFKDGSSRLFHRVADLEQPARLVQAGVARFVAICAEVREASRSSDPARKAIAEALEWEALLSPERTGDYEIRARSASKAEHRHGRVWKALVAELGTCGLQASNARVGQYGPDLYTVQPPLILFEIKSDARACDLFEGIGQLHVYERLMGRQFTKVLVVPSGASEALRRVVPGMRIRLLEYEREGQRVSIDRKSLRALIRQEL